MTALNIANIPNSITTVEELAGWCGYVLRETAPTQAYVEAVGVANFQADLQETVSPDGKHIAVFRFVFECLPPSTVVGKRWNGIKEIARSAEIPSYYLSN
ncbi:MAG: hypothetical protein KME45_32845 [Stenomitos rutilans HA7619-LM2]|nr:hypothetical protein [Stenomitos rutilans HA7619-LM2]